MPGAGAIPRIRAYSERKRIGIPRFTGISAHSATAVFRNASRMPVAAALLHTAQRATQLRPEYACRPLKNTFTMVKLKITAAKPVIDSHAEGVPRQPRVARAWM